MTEIVPDEEGPETSLDGGISSATRARPIPRMRRRDLKVPAMEILFFKSVRQGEADPNPLPDKLRRILESHIDEAETEEEREFAKQQLRLFNQPT